MDTTGGRHDNHDNQDPNELDLFKAEIFANSSDEEDAQQRPRTPATKKQISAADDIAVMGDDVILTSPPIDTVQHSMVVTKPIDEDYEEDDVSHSDCHDDESASASSVVSSRRSSTQLNGDVTPQIDGQQLASALSRVRAAATPTSATSPPATLSGNDTNQLKVPAIKRIEVTSSSYVDGDEEVPLNLSASLNNGDKNDGGVAIKSSLWQPMKPGYSPNVALSGFRDMRQAVLIRRTIAVEHNVITTEQESSFRLAIPIMSRRVSVVCAILNVMSPGLGTFTSGLTLLCGSKPRLTTINKTQVIWTNLWVAFLQLITAPLLLLGWIWSLVWATAFITISKAQYDELRDVERTDGNDRSRSPLPATGTTETTCTTTTTTTLSIEPESPLIVVNGERTTNNPSASPRDSSATTSSANASSSPDGSELIMYTGMLNHVRQPMSAVPHQHRRRRSSRPSIGLNSLPRSVNVGSEVLLTPGTLETIVINNGAFFVTGTSGSSPTTPSGERQQFMLRNPSASRDPGTASYVGKSDGRQN